jgi:hypothetical protein
MYDIVLFRLNYKLNKVFKVVRFKFNVMFMAYIYLLCTKFSCFCSYDLIRDASYKKVTIIFTIKKREF